MTILEAATALRRRNVSAVELTQAALKAIDDSNPTINAFITILHEESLSQARSADKALAAGSDRGPLHGIPVAVKDVFSTKGIRTTCGSTLFANYVPTLDAAVVEKLAAAGAVLVGKTNMHELAYGITSTNPHFGTVHNPRNLDHIPGGSSGGSGAAVAHEQVFMAMGSDTGGSIRIPAAYCGTVGLKPTFGRVSRYGVLPLDFSLDHMGPLTRSVRDAALTLDALAGYDMRDDSSSHLPTDSYLPPETISIEEVRIGWPENFFFESLDPLAKNSVERMARTAETLGARVVPIRVPDIAAINAVGRVILLSEASALMEPYLGQREQFGADVLALLDQGRLLPATDYVNAQRLRRVMRAEFNKIWNQVDCLFTPTAPIGAPRIGQNTVLIGGREEDARLATTRFVRSINVLGLPALSLPSGSTESGLPLGLQIVGPAFSEASILRTGAAIEDAVTAD